MSAFSLDNLFPLETDCPGAAQSIGAVGMPSKVRLMRSGFDTSSKDWPIFEGETEAAVRLTERVWEYKHAPDTTALFRARRWRFEFAVKIGDAGLVRAGHSIVMAQQPYENAWLQCVTLKKYSKKAGLRAAQIVPDSETLRRAHIEDPIEWLERNSKIDPWETSARFVAGFSQPKGSMSMRPRNSGGDFVVGVCRNFDESAAHLLGMNAIQRLIHETQRGRIIFWNRREVKNPPRLRQEVIEDCEHLMMMSVQQAMAGPRRSPAKWINEPAWKLAKLIYLDHLNARNRSVAARSDREVSLANVGGIIDHYEAPSVRSLRTVMR
jgi:hypothetical protein